MAYLVSFSAGVMLAAAFLDLLPEAMEAAGENPAGVLPLVLVGVVFFFFLERFLLWFHHHHSEHNIHPTTHLILVGDGFHNFIDGVALAAAFAVSIELGLVTTLAIAAHEIPQELADLSVLIHGGLSRQKALWYNFVSGLPALLGAVLAYFFFSRLTGALPPLLAFTAGMFIYIACADLIPDLHTEFKKEKRWIYSVPFLLGIALIGLLVNWLE